MRSVAPLLTASIILLLLSAAQADGFLGGRVTISGGYSVRVIDGTEERSSATFDITEPTYNLFVVDETGGDLEVYALRGDPYGYGLSSNLFHGFSFCLDYRLHRRWSLFFGWDAFWTRSSTTTLYGAADPLGPHAYYSGSLEYEFDYRLLLMYLGVRFYVVPQRWYLTFSSQPYLVNEKETANWTNMNNGVVYRESSYSDENHHCAGGHAIGTGYVHPLSSRIALAIETDYRFRVTEYLNGLSVRTHVRYRL